MTDSLGKVLRVVATLAILSTTSCSDLLGPERILRVAQVDGKSFGSCALSTGGRVFCWGFLETSGANDPNFQMTIGSRATLVAGGPKFRSIARALSAVCALAEDGEAYCAGHSELGELGRGTNESSRTFVPVAGGHRWRMISAGYFHVCGIRVDGEAWCWGNQFLGGLGNGESEGFSVSPVPVAGGLRFISIAAGGAFTCAVDVEGLLWCWGKPWSGETANGHPTPVSGRSAVPVRGVTDVRFVKVVAGGDFACALTQLGEAWCWGYNEGGQLGNGTLVTSGTPTLVSGERRYRDISVGEGTVCAVQSDTWSDCWGIQLHTSFRDPPGPPPSLVPTRETAALFRQLSDVRAVGRSKCGVSSERVLFCWGEGFYGQFGDGTQERRRLIPNSPVIPR